MKGVSLSPGQVVVLSLDGSMVFVEDVQPTFAAVVALPDQPPARDDQKGVFTPGRVGAKKISPMASFERKIPRNTLSERNLTFLDTYETLRGQHGANYIGDDALRAVAETAATQPSKEDQKAAKKAERDAAREARKADKADRKGNSGPRYLQRCTSCGEQPGHPNHGAVEDGKHEFLAPPPPVVLCIACDQNEGAHADNALNHRFIAGKAPKAPKAERAPREPRQPREPGERKEKAPKVAKPVGKFRWVDDAVKLQLLIGINGKFGGNNSGSAIIDAVKGHGEAGAATSDVLQALMAHPRWNSIVPDRVELAFQQMIGAGLLVPVA